MIILYRKLYYKRDMVEKDASKEEKSRVLKVLAGSPIPAVDLGMLHEVLPAVLHLRPASLCAISPRSAASPSISQLLSLFLKPLEDWLPATTSPCVARARCHHTIRWPGLPPPSLSAPRAAPRGACVPMLLLCDRFPISREILLQVIP